MELPSTSTALFGRTEELAQISEYLANPECRLITLVGPGGIGKTRLGIEAARQYVQLGEARAVFVDLQAIRSPEFVVTTLAESLGVTVNDSETAVERIAHYLSSRPVLLLFDNFEQVADAAGSLGELIDQAPETKVLVTSRTPLRLSQEWLFHVNGLPVPQANRPRHGLSVASTELFIDRARRMRPDFESDSEMASIERICQITEGMPLALELAASWTRMLSCEEIVAEIESNRKFLATNLRDIPERHRSMQAVFDQVLRVLDDDERAVFGKLSVFKGGFAREAAEKVAGADLQILSSLVDRSLVRRTETDRYRIHELVRQLGEDQLSNSEVALEQVQSAHCDYFTEFLAKRRDGLCADLQVEYVNEIEPELENVRAAWKFGIERGLDEQINKATLPLALYNQCRGRFSAAGELFTPAVEAFDKIERHSQGSEVMAELLTWHGWFKLRQGQVVESESIFRRCFDIHLALNLSPPSGFATDPELGLAYIASTKGDIEAARHHARSVLNRAKKQGHDRHVIMTNQLLGHLALREGDLAAAGSHARTGLDMCNSLGEKWFSAYCLDILGEIAVINGRTDEATRHFELGLKVREAFDDKAGIGLAHAYLGELSMLSGANDKARFHLDECEEAHLLVGDTGGVSRARSNLGLLDVIAGDFASAADTLSEVLDTGLKMQFMSLVLDALSGIGQMAIRAGLDDDGRRLLAFVVNHESTEPRTHSQIQRFLSESGSDADLPDSDKSLDACVKTARDVLDRAPTLAPVEPKPTGAAPSDGGLPEPLTSREVEVLGLIADGHSNQQIADELILSLGTVKWHSNQIYMKLGVPNRTSAVARARELGVLSTTV